MAMKKCALALLIAVLALAGEDCLARGGFSSGGRGGFSGGRSFSGSSRSFGSPSRSYGTPRSTVTRGVTINRYYGGGRHWGGGYYGGAYWHPLAFGPFGMGYGY